MVSTGRGWALPRGHKEMNEDALATARREIYEETGIKELAYKKDLGTYERIGRFFDGDEWSLELKNIHMFLFLTDEEKFAPTDPLLVGVRWVDFCDILALLFYEKDREFFISALPHIQELLHEAQNASHKEISHPTSIAYGNSPLGITS